MRVGRCVRTRDTTWSSLLSLEPIVIWTAKTLSAEDEGRLKSSAAAIVAKGQLGVTHSIEQLRPMLKRAAAGTKYGDL